MKHLPPAKLVELCTRLARFKKENKELLTYLLFEAQDDQAYIANVKSEINAAFDEVSVGANFYFVKKSVRKILRIASKQVRFSGSKLVEVEVLMHFLFMLNESGITWEKNPVLKNMYNAQLKKIEKALNAMHEDLQYDYLKQLEGLKR